MQCNVDYDTLIKNRAYYNTPLNYNEYESGYELCTITPYGSYFCILPRTDEVNINKFNQIKSNCNLPITFTDRRVVSHNFGDTSSWSTSGDSTFIFTPPVGKKFIMMNMRVRFPRNVQFTAENAIYFKLNMFIPAYNAVVPVLNFEYDSVSKMLRQSDDPISVPSEIIPNLGSEKIIEVNFRYSTLDALYLSPIIISGNKNENITIGTKANQPVLDINGQPLTDDAWVLFSGRLVSDF